MTSRWEVIGLSLLVLYFTYHAFAGDKGLGRWSDSQLELEDRKAELQALKDANKRLSDDIRRLNPGTVDRDFVEALAREKLAFVYPDEVILLSGEPTSAN
ncbi:MAG: FtsB family cell division protein [Hyphomonas sp.]